MLHFNKGRIFTGGIETIAEGPWHVLEDDRWGKVLADGQKIIVPRPPDENALALLTPRAVFHPGVTLAPDHHMLEGTVSRLILDKTTQKIVATLIIGNINFNATFSRREAQKAGLIPGKKLWLTYPIHAVKWH